MDEQQRHDEAVPAPGRRRVGEAQGDLPDAQRREEEEDRLRRARKLEPGDAGGPAVGREEMDRPAHQVHGAE